MCKNTVDVLLRTDYGIYNLCASCAGVGPLAVASEKSAKGCLPGTVVRRASFSERSGACQCEHIVHSEEL